MRRGRAWLLLLYVAAFPFLYAAQPFSWYWQDGRYAVFLAPAVALTLASFACQVGTWAIRSPRVAPAIMAALVLVGGAALTLRAVKVTLPYVREVSLPTVERSTWFSWHTNPNNLPTELAASLIRWHVHDAFTGYWLAYDVSFLAQGRVTVSPAGPVFIRYPPYYDAVAASPAPAWIFVSSAGRLAAGTEAGTVAIDPGCNSPTERASGCPRSSGGACSTTSATRSATADHTSSSCPRGGCCPPRYCRRSASGEARELRGRRVLSPRAIGLPRR